MKIYARGEKEGDEAKGKSVICSRPLQAMDHACFFFSPSLFSTFRECDDEGKRRQKELKEMFRGTGNNGIAPLNRFYIYVCMYRIINILIRIVL